MRHVTEKTTILTVAILAMVLAASATPATAASVYEELCVECHENSLTETVNDDWDFIPRPPGDLEGLVHLDLDCTDCHADLSETDPYDGHEDVAELVECADCHEDEAEVIAASVHGPDIGEGLEPEPRCAECHGVHTIRTVDHPRSATAPALIAEMCGRCHHEGADIELYEELDPDDLAANFSLSVHGSALFDRGLVAVANCTTCHGAHATFPTGDERSPVHADNVAETCGQCHDRIVENHRAIVRTELWTEAPERVPSCSDCHGEHESVRSASIVANATCLECHGNDGPGYVADDHGAVYVDSAGLADSVHARLACVQCHSDVTPNDEERPCATSEAATDCSVCHAAIESEYTAGIHGRLMAEGDADAPGCSDCHDPHNTLAKDDPRSPTYSRNVPELCASCHREGAPAAMRSTNGGATAVTSYRDSVHGNAHYDAGLVVAPGCADCHSAHGELPASEPESTVHRDNIEKTCSRCHEGIDVLYRQGVHWRGNGDSESTESAEHELPSCADCHSSHSIASADGGDFREQVISQCGNCHEPEVSTYFDTYHGKISRLGTHGVAKCHDCHGSHVILPMDDPDSLLSEANRVETCAKCHPGSHEGFTTYLTHATHRDREKYPWLFWAYWGMMTVLITVMGSFLLHSVGWLLRLVLDRAWKGHQPARGSLAGKHVRRFTPIQRTMHLFTMVSFLSLALSGMALKFSYMPWAGLMSNVLGGGEAMGLLHRAGAFGLLIVMVLHIRDLREQRRRSKTGWRGVLLGPNSILFNLRDVRELGQTLKWFVGLGPRPRYGRYTYWEKFDYFDVAWGSIIIGGSGTLLWFPEVFTHVIPGWFLNVATILHGIEALLAVAFIFTIHFFNTHFRPDKFPIDTVVFTGSMPVEELEHDRPDEYQALVEAGELEEALVEAPDEATKRAAKIVGFIALTLGLLLVALIVYTIFFGGHGL